MKYMWKRFADTERRLDALEPDIAAIEARKYREFISKLTDEELNRLHDAYERTPERKLPLTEEDAGFLDMLRAKYAIS